MTTRGDLPVWLTKRPSSVAIMVLLVPGGARNAIVGIHDGALKIRVTQRAVEGQANAGLTAFLAKTIGAAKSQVTIAKGHTSRRKLVVVTDVSVEQVLARIADCDG